MEKQRTGSARALQKVVGAKTYSGFLDALETMKRGLKIFLNGESYHCTLNGWPGGGKDLPTDDVLACFTTAELAEQLRPKKPAEQRLTKDAKYPAMGHSLLNGKRPTTRGRKYVARVAMVLKGQFDDASDK